MQLSIFFPYLMSTLLLKSTQRQRHRTYSKSGSKFPGELPKVYSKKCFGIDCVKFTTVKTFGHKLQLRCYEESVWASVQGQGVRYKKPHKLQTWRLFRYITGGNEAHEKLIIGSPFMRLFDDTKRIYTIEFLLPTQIYCNGNAPKPRDDKVRLAKRRPFCAYVHWTRNLAHNTTSVEALHQHTYKLLKANNLTSEIYTDYYFYALYGRNQRTGESTNEIWYLSRYYVDPDWELGKDQHVSASTIENDIESVPT